MIKQQGCFHKDERKGKQLRKNEKETKQETRAVLQDHRKTDLAK